METRLEFKVKVTHIHSNSPRFFYTALEQKPENYGPWASHLVWLSIV